MRITGEGKIDDELIRLLMGWRHTSGFSVDNGVRVARDDEEGKEALAQYILRFHALTKASPQDCAIFYASNNHYFLDSLKLRMVVMS